MVRPRSTRRLGLAAAAIAAVVLAGASADAALIETGTYRLSNHPDSALQNPGYGLRLDELFNVSDGLDNFTFDFNADGAAMFLEYDGVTIHIYGTAFGGLDIGETYDPAMTSLVDIDFVYSDPTAAPGDDDILVLPPDVANTGSITWLETGEEIALFDKAGANPYTFRFGDEDNDAGHRGFDGISGWGWLTHHEPVFPTGGTSDWIFTGERVPAPGAMALLGAGMLFGRRRRQA